MKLETIKKVKNILDKMEYYQDSKLKWEQCTGYNITLFFNDSNDNTSKPNTASFGFLNIKDLKKLAIQSLDKEILKLENELKVLTKELEYVDKQETN